MKASGCLFSPEAEADLIEIIAYIAAADPVAARKLIAAIQNACDKLVRMPSLGHRREDLTPDPEVFFSCVRNRYLIVYRKAIRPLQIVRVLHGARDLASELRRG